MSDWQPISTTPHDAKEVLREFCPTICDAWE